MCEKNSRQHSPDTEFDKRAREDWRVAIATFGCRVNKYDSAVLRGELAARGFRLADESEAFDLLILNSCTVTEAADRATLRLIRRIRREHPLSLVLLTGCFAELSGPEQASSLGVDLLVGNTDKARLVDRLEEYLGFDSEDSETPNFSEAELQTNKGSHHEVHEGTRRKETNLDLKEQVWAERRSSQPEEASSALLPDQGSHTRFFFKVQEGCDVRCAFCIIPDARGHSRSLPPDEVVEVIRRAVAKGFREVILSGIHLGAYGRDLPGESGLGRLVERVLRETSVERLRLGSVEPWGVRPDLIELLKNEDRFLPSLHLPLQSGSETILRSMGRPITASRYRQLIEQIREARPDLTLWLDVIAGFPGETDALFEESFDFIANIDFTHLHVFPYSVREGTRAVGFPDRAPEPVIKARVARLMALSESREQGWLERRVGSQDEVLVEMHARGHTRDNLPVQLDPTEVEGLRGEIVQVRLNGVRGGRLVGEVGS